MDVFADYLAGIDDPADRGRMQYEPTHVHPSWNEGSGH